MKAILQYHSGLGDDTSIVNEILAKNNILVLKSKYIQYETETLVTIYIEDYHALNQLVALLNKESEYGVKIFKIKPDFWGGEKMKKCDCYRTKDRIIGWLGPDEAVKKEIHVCDGTKEQDECTCGGDRAKCDFYAHVRENAR